MFSGIQEILVLVIIILIILVAPRILNRQQPSIPAASAAARTSLRFTGRLRLAIVVSILWPLISAAYFQPWQSEHLGTYLYCGPGPVIFGWGIAWVITGFKKKN